VPSLPPIDAKSSVARTETEPSVGGGEGTGDRLNEAPRCPRCNRLLIVMHGMDNKIRCLDCLAELIRSA